MQEWARTTRMAKGIKKAIGRALVRGLLPKVANVALEWLAAVLQGQGRPRMIAQGSQSNPQSPHGPSPSPGPVKSDGPNAGGNAA